MTGPVARLAELFDARVPRDAVMADAGDVLAIAWHPYGIAGRTAHILYARRGGKARIGVDTGAASPLDAAGVARMARENEAWHDPTVLLRAGDPTHPAPHPDPVRARLLLLIASTLDAPAYLAMEAAGLEGEACLDALCGPDGPSWFALCETHPWLVGAAVEAGAAPGGDPDAVAADVIERLTGRRDAPARALAARFRGFVLPGFIDGPAQAANVAGLLAIGCDLLPRADAGDGGRGALAAYFLAPVTDAMARACGRSARDVLGRPGDWVAYSGALARKAGLTEGVDPDEDPYWTATAALDACHEMADLLTAFARDVLAPALALCGRSWVDPPEGPGSRDVATILGDPVVAGGLRLMLGERTLAALAETTGRWHSRADGIARHVAAILADDAPAGPALFSDVALPGERYLTCLYRVGDLLDEGAPGPDRTGAMGLDHCVGGYGEAVALGRTAIVSLRRRLADGGYERVSTAEIDFSAGGDGAMVVQHRGPGNAAPEAADEAHLRRALAGVRDIALDTLRAHRAIAREWPAVASVVARRGGWEGIRDLWAFALPRRLRGLDAASLLREAGLDAPRDADA